ncbi:hypothetical protein D9M72_397940 [compost metagenome]
MLPQPAQPRDLRLDQRDGDAPAIGQRGEPRHAGRQVAEVAAPDRLAALRKAQVGRARLGVEAHHAVVLGRVQGQQVVEVGLDVLGPLCEAGQVVGPEVDAREQVFAKAPLRHVAAQVAVGAGDELEVALHFLVGAHGEEALFLDGLEQHRLFVQAELADLVEKQRALVRGAQQPRAVARRAGERALLVPEQRGGRTVAAQRGAVHLDERPRHLVARLLQLEHAARQERLARARRPHQQDRRARAHGHALDLVDERVEARIARGDAALQKGDRVALVGVEAARDRVVARQVEVDQRDLAGVALALLARRRGLGQHARHHARFRQQEHADLRHVRARGDVRPVLLALGLEGVGARPVVQARVDLAEVPRVFEVEGHEVDRGLGRHGGDVGLHQLGQRRVLARVQQLDARHHHVVVLRERDRGAPLVPAARALAGIELGAEESDDDDGLHG